MTQQNFDFRFYRFTGPREKRTTELIRDFSIADGMRGLVDQGQHNIEQAIARVQTWALTKGINVKPLKPFPSAKHPGKVWLEFRFSGLSL